MHLKQLRYFVEVARWRSLSTASKKLNLTQQALSVAIKNLETDLRVPLLVRTSKGCGLTPAGERLLAFAESVLSGYVALQEDIDGLAAVARNCSGRLHIYCNSPFYFYFHPKVVRDFCREYPLWKVSITELPAHEIYQRLALPDQNDEWSIGIVNIPFEEDGGLSSLFAPPPGCTFTPLVRGGYLACVSRHSPLAANKSLSLAAVLKGPVVMGASAEAMITPLHHLLNRHGKADFVLSAATPNVWALMIAGNAGTGLLHEAVLYEATAAERMMEDLALIPIREKLDACTGYVLAAPPPEPVRAFIELLPREGVLKPGLNSLATN